MKSSRTTRTGAVALVLVSMVGLAACSDDSGSDGSSSENKTTQTSDPSGNSAVVGQAATATQAAELRAGLTDLLTQHVYLAGIALKTAVDAGGDLEDPSVKAAVATLDANSVALSKAVGSAYPDAEEPFLQSWRQHIGFFVNYTLGKATGDQAMAKKAEKDLDGYRTSFGQLINSVVPELPADAVAKELVPHVNSVLATIDSLVAGDGKVFANLEEAAHHMPMTAATLAGGIAENKQLS